MGFNPLDDFIRKLFGIPPVGTADMTSTYQPRGADDFPTLPPDWAGGQIQHDIDRRRKGKPTREDVLTAIRNGQDPANFDLGAYNIPRDWANYAYKYRNEPNLPSREDIIQSIRSGETKSSDHDLYKLGIDPIRDLNELPGEVEAKAARTAPGVDQTNAGVRQIGQEAAARRAAIPGQFQGFQDRMAGQRTANANAMDAGRASQQTSVDDIIARMTADRQAAAPPRPPGG